MVTLFIPHDFSQPGKQGCYYTQGFTLLAQDEKGALVRIDDIGDIGADQALLPSSVLFTARTQHPAHGPLLRAIRPASHADRYQRFRRPEHLDWLQHSCCDQPCRFMAIYDEGSGSFFDLQVSAAQALQTGSGPLFYTFACEQCGCMHELPVAPAG